MVEIRYIRRDWTWTNNKEGEGFVEERLDRFFASLEWIYQFPNAVVHHIQKQASDHCLLILDDKPQAQHITRRFYFDKRFLDIPDVEKEIDNAWNTPQQGTLMFRVYERIKSCRISLLKQKREH